MEINRDKPSKGAEQILLAQIKQEFTAPADAIEQYIDLVSQYIEENNIAVEDLALLHISEPTRHRSIWDGVFCLK